MSTGGRSSSVATRARILDAAILQLSRSSDGDFSTRSICELAEVTAPTIYHHFGDKEGLLDAALTEVFRAYLERRRQLPVTDDPVADFIDGCRAHVEFGLSEPIVFMTVYGRPNAQRRSMAAQLSFDYLLEQLQRVEESGRLLVPIRIAADLVDAALSGVVLHLIRFDETVDAPFVALTRDGLMAKIIRPPRRAGTPVMPAAVRTRARKLSGELAGGAVNPLGEAESTLLREWLDRIAASND